MSMTLMPRMLFAVAALCVAMPSSAVLASDHQAQAELRDREGNVVGKARLTEERKRGVRIRMEVTGLSPGMRAFHIHETGACEAPGFQSAGGHFNPGGTEHGFWNPAGHHAGDMPNVHADAEGNAKVDGFAPMVTLKKGKPNSLLREGGTALVIHAGVDDHQTDPAGDAGDRIVCGVIEPADK